MYSVALQNSQLHKVVGSSTIHTHVTKPPFSSPSIIRVYMNRKSKARYFLGLTLLCREMSLRCAVPLMYFDVILKGGFIVLLLF